ncbi:MAG: acyltransferase family protein [Bacteroidales bacterium]
MAQKQQRLLSLDVLRGITIAGMIMVNNPGSWSAIYAPLRHASWNGLTPTDLVFPFFMFIMGVSTYMSLSKFDFKFSGAFLKKLIKRTIIIFAIGLAIDWFANLCYGAFNISDTTQSFGARLFHGLISFDHLRILGVMQRLALSYCFASLIVVFVPLKYLWKTIVLILISYFIILYYGNGFELSDTNIIARVDLSLWGADHMYKEYLPDGSRISFDPEGLLSTIPCIAQVLIGFKAGDLLKNTSDIHQKVERLLIWGTILFFAGALLSYGCPVNKKIWSPTYVLVTCGLASSFLGLLIWIIDINGKKNWSSFFEAFGVNPLFMYVLGAFLSILLGSICFETSEGIVSLHGYIYQSILSLVMNPYLASLLFAIAFIMVNWVIGYILYKKKIYIKI